MKSVRKIIGLILIVFLGMPILFGIIWAVGLSRAAMSPKFVSELPQKIIDAVPDMADEFIKEGQNANVVRDEESRLWFQAMAKTGTSPRDLLVKTGILPWMKNELQTALTDLADVLKGNKAPDRIAVDLRPLKKALLSPDFEAYLLSVLKNLPPCDAAGTGRWAAVATEGFGRTPLPACQPDLAVAQEAFRVGRERAVNRMDDEVQIFEGFYEAPFSLAHALRFLLWGLFVIPAIFLFGGALVAASSPADFLKWSGLPIFITGLITLGLAGIVRSSAFFFYFFRWAPFRRGHEWSFDFGPLVLEKARWAARLVLDQLFTPVMAVAGGVCVVGLVLFALSFSARSHRA
jgi:hypothetical protein